MIYFFFFPNHVEKKNSLILSSFFLKGKTVLKKNVSKKTKKGNKTCVEEKKEAIYEELLDFTRECTVPISKKKKASVEKKKTKKKETISIKTADEGFKLKRSVQHQQQILNMVSIEELETLKLGVLYKTLFWNQVKITRFFFLFFSFFLILFFVIFVKNTLGNMKLPNNWTEDVVFLDSCIEQKQKEYSDNIPTDQKQEIEKKLEENELIENIKKKLKEDKNYEVEDLEEGVFEKFKNKTLWKYLFLFYFYFFTFIFIFEYFYYFTFTYISSSRKKTVDSNDLVDTCSQLKGIDLIRGFQFAQTKFDSKELEKTFSKFLFQINRFELISSLVSKLGTSSFIDNFFRGTSESSLADSFFSIIFFNQKARNLFLDLEFEYLETSDNMSSLFNCFSLTKVQKSSLVKDVFSHQTDDQLHDTPEKDLILSKLCMRKKNMHLDEFLKGFYDTMLFFSLYKKKISS